MIETNLNMLVNIIDVKKQKGLKLIICATLTSRIWWISNNLTASPIPTLPPWKILQTNNPPYSGTRHKKQVPTHPLVAT